VHRKIDIMSADGAAPIPVPDDVRTALARVKGELLKLLHRDSFVRFKTPLLESIETKYEEFLSSDNDNVVANATRRMIKEQKVYKCERDEFEQNFVAKDGTHSKAFKEWAAKNFAADSVEAVLLIHRMENLKEFDQKFRKHALVFWEKHQDPLGYMQVNLPAQIAQGITDAFTKYGLDQESCQIKRAAKEKSKEELEKTKEEARAAKEAARAAKEAARAAKEEEEKEAELEKESAKATKKVKKVTKVKKAEE
jgi:hypothetical protein